MMNDQCFSLAPTLTGDCTRNQDMCPTRNSRNSTCKLLVYGAVLQSAEQHRLGPYATVLLKGSVLMQNVSASSWDHFNCFSITYIFCKLQVL